MSQDDSLTTLLEKAIRNRLAEVATATAAVIVSYDYKTQKASVRPVVHRKYADGQTAQYPVITNVPVIFPRSGGASITFPVKPGDSVMLVFAARSLDSWLNSGAASAPDDNRMHSINDAIAIPGLYPFTTKSKAKNNTDVLLTYAGCNVTITGGGEINLQSPTKVTVDAPELRATGDLIVNGNIYDLAGKYGTFNRIRDIFNTHTHDENDSAPSPTDVPNQLLGEL